MEQYREVIKLDEIPADDYFKVVRALIEYLNVEIIREATPDYTSYEVRAKK